MRHSLITFVFLAGCAARHPQVISTQYAPEVPTPTADNPVAATLWLTTARDALELHLQLHIAPGHHLYANTSAPFTPTTVHLTSPDLLPTGPLQSPIPDAQGHLTGVVEFRQQLRLAPTAAPGTHDLACDVTFQACNPELCWPPRTLTLKTSFTVIEKGSS
ncbi:MAG: disulfide bond corrector protein DsbC [Phycisphaerales bacterium]|nr:disulfide bond corrector protein DsbC [Phycisphaerales bacterium]